MRIIVSVLAAIIVAPFASWGIIAGICSLPGVGASNACGHNAPVLLIVVGPISFLAAAILIHYLIRERKELPASERDA